VTYTTAAKSGFPSLHRELKQSSPRRSTPRQRRFGPSHPKHEPHVRPGRNDRTIMSQLPLGFRARDCPGMTGQGPAAMALPSFILKLQRRQPHASRRTLLNASTFHRPRAVARRPRSGDSRQFRMRERVVPESAASGRRTRRSKGPPGRSRCSLTRSSCRLDRRHRRLHADGSSR